MINVIENVQPKRRKEVMRHPVKLTALIYLKEALLKQRYEDCPAIVQIAKEYGAADFEIQDLLEDQRRVPL